MILAEQVYVAKAFKTHAPSPFLNIWKVKAPIRILAFAWLAAHRTILAMDYQDEFDQPKGLSKPNRSGQPNGPN